MKTLKNDYDDRLSLEQFRKVFLNSIQLFINIFVMILLFVIYFILFMNFSNDKTYYYIFLQNLTYFESFILEYYDVFYQ